MIQKFKNLVKSILIHLRYWFQRLVFVNKKTLCGQPGKFIEREIEYAFLFNNLCRSPGYRLLEIAPGKSGMSLVLTHCNYLVTAIDLDIFHPWVVKMDATKMEFPDNSFDVVCSISVFEHIEEVDQAIAEVLRVVKPGGIIILSFPYNSETFIKDINDYQAISYIISIYNDQKLSEWFGGKGEIVDVDYWKQWDGDLFGQGKKLPRTIRVTKEQAQGICIAVKKL